MGGGNFLICTPGAHWWPAVSAPVQTLVYPRLPPSKHLQQTIISSFHSRSLEATNENENPFREESLHSLLSISRFILSPAFANDDGSLSMIFDNVCQQSESQGRSIMQRCNGLETLIQGEDIDQSEKQNEWG